MIKSILLFILILCFSVLADQNMTKAYSYYLLKDYDSSMVYYQKSLEVSPENRDAIYGLINCNLAVENYAVAVGFCDTILNKDFDKVAAQKKIYLLGLLKKRRESSKVFDYSISHTLSDTTVNSLINSAGYGFLYAGDYRESVRWFRLNDSLFKKELAYAKKLRSDIVKLNFGIYGGMALFTHEILSDINSPFAFDNSNFFSATFSVVNRGKFTFDFEYTRTNYNLKYIYYNYKSIDTLFSWGDSGQLEKLEKYKNSPDTNYIIYSFPSDINSADSIYYVYNEVISTSKKSYDTTVTVTPNPALQHDFYFSLKDNYAIFENTEFGLSVRYTNSNISNTESVTTIWGMHGHKIKKLRVKSNYFYSFLPNYLIAQWSPLLYFLPNDNFGFGMQGNFTKAFAKGRWSKGITESFQSSGDVFIDAYLKKISIYSHTYFGQTSFINQFEGRIIHNTNFNLLVAEKLSTMIYPFKFPLSFYLGVEGKLFDEYKKIDFSGGVLYRW